MIDIYRRRPFLMFSHRNNPYCELLQFHTTKVGLFSINAISYCKKDFYVELFRTIWHTFYCLYMLYKQLKFNSWILFIKFTKNIN